MRPPQLHHYSCSLIASSPLSKTPPLDCTIFTLSSLARTLYTSDGTLKPPSSLYRQKFPRPINIKVQKDRFRASMSPYEQKYVKKYSRRGKFSFKIPIWTISRCERVSNSSVVQENQLCTSFPSSLFSDLTLVVEMKIKHSTNANNTNQGFFF